MPKVYLNKEDMELILYALKYAKYNAHSIAYDTWREREQERELIERISWELREENNT